MRIPSTLRMAWRNLGRNRRRTALALTAIATAQLALVVYESLLNGYVDWTIQVVTGPLVGHVQVHAPDWREDRSMDRVLPHVGDTLAALRANPGVARAAARVYAPALVALGEQGHAAMAMGVDPTAEANPEGLLAKIPPGAFPRQGQALLGKGLAEVLGASVGMELALVGQAADGSVASELFTVSGVISTPSDMVNRLGLILSLDQAQQLFALPDEAHEIVVHGRDPRQAEALASRLATLPVLAGAEVLPWKAVVPELASMIDVVGAAGLFVLVLVFVAAASGVANTMLMSTFDRIHELGMLLALGARPGRIVRMILAESLVLGALGVAAGSLLALALVFFTHRGGVDLAALGGASGGGQISYAGLEWTMRVFPRAELRDLLRGVVAVAVTSLLAGLWPATRAARQQPAEAMRA